MVIPSDCRLCIIRYSVELKFLFFAAAKIFRTLFFERYVILRNVIYYLFSLIEFNKKVLNICYIKKFI